MCKGDLIKPPLNLWHGRIVSHITLFYADVDTYALPNPDASLAKEAPVDRMLSFTVTGNNYFCSPNQFRAAW